MKVVYHERIEEKLDDAITYAEASLRKIEYIELTQKEMDELLSRCSRYFTSPSIPTLYMGVPLKVVT